jgi:hypothetical protein
MRSAKADRRRPEACPMMRFCGLLVSIMALPMLELVASASRNGTADILTRVVISSSKGVPNNQTVSFGVERLNWPLVCPLPGWLFPKTAKLHCPAGAMNIYLNNACMLSARSGGTNSTPLLPHFRISRPRLINISFLFVAALRAFF